MEQQVYFDEKKIDILFRILSERYNTINDLIDDEGGFFAWNRITEKYELDKGLYIKYAGLLKALPANWRKL